MSYPCRVERSEDEEPTAPGGRGRLRLAIAFMVVVSGVFVLFIGAHEFRSRGTRSIGGRSVADQLASAHTDGGDAPNIELPAVAGPDVSLRSLRGHIVVVNFWASWCGPCRREAPGLRRASVDYVAQGVRFLGVDERDDRPSAASFLGEFKISYPSAFDPSGALADDYRLDGIPSTFVVDAEGRVRYRFFGFLEEATIRGALDRLTSGAETVRGAPPP